MLSLQDIVMRLAASGIVMTLSGLVAAYVAKRGGDPGPTHDGRLSASPARHFDLVGAVAGVLYATTWTRPLDIDPYAFRRPWLATTGILLCNSALLLAVAALSIFARPVALSLIGPPAATTVILFLNATAALFTSSAILLLFPVPPLLGANILARFLGRERFRHLMTPAVRSLGRLAIVVALHVGLYTHLLRPASQWFRAALGF